MIFGQLEWLAGTAHGVRDGPSSTESSASAILDSIDFPVNRFRCEDAHDRRGRLAGL